MDGVCRGVLERFLNLWDIEIDRLHDKIRELLWTQNIDQIPDKWLALLGSKVGHIWRTDRSHDWNRRRIRYAIRRWSYKGSTVAISDILAEFGIEDFEITDMASKLIVLDLQGGLSTDNCHFPDADFYHDGAFLLTIDRVPDLDGFTKELKTIVPSATRWYLRIRSQGAAAANEDVCTIKARARTVSSNANNHSLGEGLLDESLWLSPLPAGDVDFKVLEREFGVHGGLVTMDSRVITFDAPDVFLDTVTLPTAQALKQEGPRLINVLFMRHDDVFMDRDDITMDMFVPLDFANGHVAMTDSWIAMDTVSEFELNNSTIGLNRSDITLDMFSRLDRYEG